MVTRKTAVVVVVVSALAVVGLAAGILLTGYASAPAAVADSASRTSAPPTGAPSTAAALASAAEMDFYTTLSTTTDLELNNDRSKLVSAGHWACDQVTKGGVAPSSLMWTLVGSGWTMQNASMLLFAAERHLCPEMTYVDVRPSITTLTPTVAPPGPATQITGEGVFEVGPEIVPGKWKTSGGQGCYWARLKPETRDIIDNGLIDGPEVVWLKEGELFETNDCGTWAAAR